MLTDPASTARSLAFGRAALGMAMLAAPTLAARPWLGEDAERESTRAVVRALGVREVLLGGLAAHVINRPGVGRRMVASLAVCDLADLTATWLSRRGLPSTGVGVIVLLAGGGAAAGFWAAARLPEA